MSPSDIFLACNTGAFAGWIILGIGVLTGSVFLRDRVAGLAAPVALCLVYASVMAMALPGSEGGFDSLENVMILFGKPWAVLGGWVHYLAFDLFVGSFIARQVMESRVPNLFLIVLLPLAFMLGPVGFLAFQVARIVYSGKRKVFT